MKIHYAAAALVLLGSAFAATGKNLEIYFVDVEGGAATLIVSPSGESMLVDTGNPAPDNRDANRIYEATKLAGLTQIDILLTTHYHRDHIGGLAVLKDRIPIRRFLDHGDNTEAPYDLYNTYLAIAGKNRTAVQVGDRIPLKDLEIQVVAAHGKRPARPIEGNGANPFCAGAITKELDKDPDNNASVGFRLKYGKFTFLDLGDLDWHGEHPMACPQNLIGRVEVYQTDNHGMDRSGAPQLVKAVEPQVVVMNNSGRKGASAVTMETLRTAPSKPDVWQGHKANALPPGEQGDEQMMANIGAPGVDDGHWIKISVDEKGDYTLTNGRNGFSKTYKSR